MKFVAVAAAFVMQVCLGGIYAWSAFVPELHARYGYSTAQTQFVFGATIAVLCLAMMATGRIQDRRGPRLLAAAGGVLLSAGYLTAGFFGSTFAPLLLGLGLINGLAIACGYVCAIATGVKWFPRHKGAVTGLTVGGYGGGAILLSAIAQFLFARGWPVLHVFRLVGLIYGPVIVAASLLLAVPRPAPHAGLPVARRRDLWRDRRFLALGVGLFCGSIPGLTVIGNLKPMGLGAGLSAAVATASISALAAGNITGRMAWGALQDRWGAGRITVLSLLGCGASVLLLAAAGGRGPAFLAAAALVGFCYGGTLSIYAAQAAHLYGVHAVGSVYAAALLLHGAAALAAPPLAGWLVDRTGGYGWPIALAAATGAAGAWGYRRLMRQDRPGAA